MMWLSSPYATYIVVNYGIVLLGWLGIVMLSYRQYAKAQRAWQNIVAHMSSFE